MTAPAPEITPKTILLVDDEPSVRSIIIKILRRANYTVLEAEGGPAAMQIAQAYPAKIDMIITDLYMPGQQGPEVVKELELIRPGLKVLFISGYADADVVARTGVSAGANFLHKPFSGQELIAAVLAALA